MQDFSKLRWIVFLGLLVWLTWVPCPESAVSDDAVYRLGVGDVVKISILAGGEEQVTKEMVVGDTGDITIPFIGKLSAAGLTINELERQIIAPLARDFFVNPQVHLYIKEYHSLKFFISGAIEKPGVFSLNFIPTIMDLIAKAGGVTTERGNLAYVLRGMKDPVRMTEEKALEGLDAQVPTQSIAGTKPIIVDLQRLLDEGDMTENIHLATGDTVYIPPGTKLNQAATKIYVQGKIKKPGVFDYQPGITALAACIMAGGFDQFAAPNRARIIRQTGSERIVITIDLKKVQTGDEPDLPLQPGDRIHIPESWL